MYLGKWGTTRPQKFKKMLNPSWKRRDSVIHEQGEGTGGRKAIHLTRGQKENPAEGTIAQVSKKGTSDEKGEPKWVKLSRSGKEHTIQKVLKPRSSKPLQP